MNTAEERVKKYSPNHCHVDDKRETRMKRVIVKQTSIVI